MLKTICFSLIAVLSSVVPGQANAATITQTFLDQHVGTLFGPTGITITGEPFSFSQAVNQFDPAQGTLNSVNVDLDFDFEVAGTTGPTGGSIGGGLSASYKWNGSTYFGGGSGTGTGSGPGTPISAAMGVSGNQDLPLPLSIAIGTGTVEWRFDGLANLNVDSLGTATGTYSLVSDSLIVTYDYTPSASAVPEPSALVLLGIATCGAVGARWRRRKPSATAGLSNSE